MDLFLIRHGETVDNVAGLYAGVRDSQLTNHGLNQTKRLGEHFAKRHTFTHIFASPLTRTLKTAQAIRGAQPIPQPDGQPVDIVQVPELIEQHFGSCEGKTFHARTGAKKTGRAAYRLQHKDDPGFVDVESQESMNKRADVFLDDHLMPLFSKHQGRLRVAVVSHGKLLSHLWRRLLLRLPSKSVSVEPTITAARGPLVLQHLGGWSNTGYLELSINNAEASSLRPEDEPSAQSLLDGAPTEADVATAGVTTVGERQHLPAELRLPAGWTTVILAVDRKDHLTGLKRQRGGIGQSAHDDQQGKLESFFKKQRTS